MGSVHLTTLRCPMVYFGGKQVLAKRITAMFPEHKTYVEPFCGGAAVFWDKPKSDVEVLSDVDFDVINFYKSIKYYQYELQCMINNLEFNRTTQKKAHELLRYPFNPDNINVMRACVFWYTKNSSFNGLGGLGLAEHAKSKADWITHQHKERLADVHLYNASAFDVIEMYDSHDTLFYVDPPYFNAYQNYFKNFTAHDYKRLLYVLSKIRGKFILSGYPSYLLTNFTKLFKWNTEKLELESVAVVNGRKRNKIEEITSNFKI